MDSSWEKKNSMKGAQDFLALLKKRQNKYEKVFFSIERKDQH